MGDSCEMMRDSGLGYSDRVLQATVSGSRVRLLKPTPGFDHGCLCLAKRRAMAAILARSDYVVAHRTRQFTRCKDPSPTPPLPNFF